MMFRGPERLPASAIWFARSRSISQWLRERTRLMDQAAMWRARSDDLKGATSDATLIRGNVLEEATNWMARTPKGETIPQDVVQFIEASTALEARLKVELAANLNERERAIEKANRASGRVRFASIIGAGVSLALLVLRGLSGGWPRTRLPRPTGIERKSAKSGQSMK